ncbi:MAG: NF038130 family PEP-CTERM protein [Pseudanabaena sp. ELA607]|jgi:hypothetical protein
MQPFLRNTSVAIFTGVVSVASLFAAGNASATGIQGINFGGSAASDYYVYGTNSSNQTVKIPSTKTNAQSVLDGNAASPTGNVELAGSSETSGFDFNKNTTLSGKLGTKYGLQTITLSSLTASDWVTLLPSGKTLQQQWFDDLEGKYKAIDSFSVTKATSAANTAGTTAYNSVIAKGGSVVAANAAKASAYNSAYTQAYNITYSSTYSSAYNAFINPSSNYRQRLSDPNISYVNSANDSSVKIGLAGFYDSRVLATPGAVIDGSIPSNLLTLLGAVPANIPIQASELVKITYGDNTSYLYSFSATKSLLVASDDYKSHTGNYEIVVPPLPKRSVPVPAAFLGIVAAGAMGSVMLKRRQAHTA